MNGEPTLICPYCDHAFPLTWARYWRATWRWRGGSDKHTCPSCEMVGHLIFTRAYFIRTLVAMWGALAIAGIAGWLLTPQFGYSSYFATVLVALAAAFIMDRRNDATRPFRQQDDHTATFRILPTSSLNWIRGFSLLALLIALSDDSNGRNLQALLEFITGNASRVLRVGSLPLAAVAIVTFMTTLFMPKSAQKSKPDSGALC